MDLLRLRGGVCGVRVLCMAMLVTAGGHSRRSHLLEMLIFLKQGSVDAGGGARRVITKCNENDIFRAEIKGGKNKGSGAKAQSTPIQDRTKVLGTIRLNRDPDY